MIVSRIGRKIIKVYDAITYVKTDSKLEFSYLFFGKLIKKHFVIPKYIRIKTIKLSDDSRYDHALQLIYDNDGIKRHHAMYGTLRQLINNLIEGINDPYRVVIESNHVKVFFVKNKQETDCFCVSVGTVDLKKYVKRQDVKYEFSEEGKKLTLISCDWHSITLEASKIQKMYKINKYTGKGLIINNQKIIKKKRRSK